MSWVNLIQQEMTIYMQNQNSVTNEANYVNFYRFEGKNTSRNGKNFVWIIDSSVSTHMYSDLSLFHIISTIPNKSTITLLDGTSKHVNRSRTIKLSSKIILQYALYVPHFKHNLLSVKSF